MAYSNHNKYVSYPDWFGSQKQQIDSKTGTSTTIVYRGGGASDTDGGSGTTGITGITVTGSGNAVTSGILDGTTIVLNKDLTFLTKEQIPSSQNLWELRLTEDGRTYLYADYDIVTLGGHTMYADNGDIDLPGLYDGLPIDSNTIYWEILPDGTRVLKAKFIEDTGVDASEVLSIVANAGYAKQTWVSERYSTIDYVNTSITELTKYVNDTFVTFENDEVITGLKTFTKGIQIGNPESSLIKINQLQDDVLYIDSNVVIRGGLTMYYDNGEIDLPSIKDEIGNAGYDGATGLASFDSSQFVIGADGTVSIISGSSGLNTEELKYYLDTNKYTTETWVKEQGYASASSLSSLQNKVNDFLEGSDTDTIINKWKELEAFLSGLSESDNLATILATKWTTDNNLINQWNTAYGWGDHSKVGYALKSYVDNTFVTIAGNEDVTGVHNFVNGLKIGGVKLSRTTDDIIYLEGNLVVRGGVTMYALDDATVDSIIDALPLASTSALGIAKFNPSNFIINEDGFVTIISGSGGLDTEGLEQYLTTNKYATQGWVEGKGYITSSALNGYATQSWVTNQKYITGITSAMVVAALGYTPFNNASFTKANIKSTLGISDWVLATSKPSYTFSEIGSKPTTLGGYGITDAYTKTQADALYAKYLPLTGGTLTGDVIIKTDSTGGTPKLIFQRGTTSDGSFDQYMYNANGFLWHGYVSNGVFTGTLGIYTTDMRPANNNSFALGIDKIRFSNVYSVLGNFSDEVSMKSANINGGKITYDATNGYFKLEGDLLVTGGVSMYSDDSEFTPSTIMDGVVVDGTSIRKNPTTGALEVIGGSGATVKYPLSWSGFSNGSYDGSVAQSFYIPTKLSEFVNDKSFATTSDLSGYLPTSGGTINGSLLISNESLNTQLTIRRTDGGGSPVIRYTNSNDGVLGSIGIAGAWSQSNAFHPIFLDKNNTENRIYHSGNLTPTEILTQLKTVDGSGSGLDADLLDGKHYSDIINGNVASATYATSAGSSQKLLCNTDTTVGTYLSYIGDQFIAKGDTSDGSLCFPVGGYSFGEISDGAYGNIIRLYAKDKYYHDLAFNMNTSSPYWRQVVNGVTKGWRSFAFTDSNVASATKLETPRTIWGQSFDGTANVTGTLIVGDGNLILNNNKELQWKNTNSENIACMLLQNNNNLLIGSGVKLKGSRTIIAGGDVEINTAAGTTMHIAKSGNVLIGATTDSGYKLDVNGTIHTNSSLWIDNIEIKKSQDDVLYIDGNLVVRGGVTMYGENEVDIPTLMDAIAVDATMYNEGGILGVVKASTTKAGAAMFDSNFFSVDANGLVTLTNAPSSVTTLGSLQYVDASVDSTATVDRVLYQAAGSSTWTWKELPKDGVVGDYLPLSGGTMTGGVVIAPSASYTTAITNNCTVLKLGSDTSGMNGYNSGLGFNALQRYSSTYLQHLHAWIGLSPCISSAGSELYDLIFATNGSVTANTSPIERMRITHDGSVRIQSLFLGNSNEINSTDGAFLCLNYEGTGGILMSNNGQGVVVASGWNSLSSTIQQRLSNCMFSVRGGIFSYMENVTSNAAAYVFDKPGSHFTGIGSNGEADTIYFGAVDTTNLYSWVSYSQRWKFGGSIITTGGITMYSDIRKKQKLQDVELSLSQIANAPLIEHYYLSDQDKTTHVGSIAQYWAEMNDWFCKLDAEGYYTMEIQNAALASAISIARHLERYESKTDKKIRMLKKRITELEDKLEKLEGGNYGSR